MPWLLGCVGLPVLSRLISQWYLVIAWPLVGPPLMVLARAESTLRLSWLVSALGPAAAALALAAEAVAIWSLRAWTALLRLVAAWAVALMGGLRSCSKPVSPLSTSKSTVKATTIARRFPPPN